MIQITRHQQLRRLAFAAMALATGFIGTRVAHSQTLAVLHAFTGKADGWSPQAGLTVDSSGNLYGTTYHGGDNNLGACFDEGCGVVFKIDTANNFTVLHTFTATPDGNNSTAGLTTVTPGVFFGTTGGGGPLNNGTIFKIDTLGNESILHSFHGADGFAPEQTLTRAANGYLYGTASAGGATGQNCGGGGCGVVFKVSPSGAFTVLHSFLGGSDGETPQSAPVVDAAGNVYGVTIIGGPGPCTFAGPGCGVVYKIDPSGNETILHTFVSTDGASPFGIALDAAGSLYGTTFTRGEFDYGNVYKIDATGNFSVLYSFTGGSDGAQPDAALVLDSAGNIYGTTNTGGSTTGCSFGCGVVFRIDATGHYGVLHRFDGIDGAAPLAPLLLYRGAIYGTTAGGGTGGVVFKIAP